MVINALSKSKWLYFTINMVIYIKINMGVPID